MQKPGEKVIQGGTMVVAVSGVATASQASGIISVMSGIAANPDTYDFWSNVTAQIEVPVAPAEIPLPSVVIPSVVNMPACVRVEARIYAQQVTTSGAVVGDYNQVQVMRNGAVSGNFTPAINIVSGQCSQPGGFVIAGNIAISGAGVSGETTPNVAGTYDFVWTSGIAGPDAVQLYGVQTGLRVYVGR